MNPAEVTIFEPFARQNLKQEMNFVRLSHDRVYRDSIMKQTNKVRLLSYTTMNNKHILLQNLKCSNFLRFTLSFFLDQRLRNSFCPQTNAARIKF